MSCERRFDVGVYLLGALDPAERAACEEHLQGCADCTAELRRLGGLPGLLARATWSGSAEGADPDQVDGPPPGLLDGVHTRIRRDRRLRTLVAASAAVVVLALGVVIGMAVGPPSSSEPTEASGPTTVTDPVRTVALQATGGAPVRGEAGLVDRPWGTAISLRCRAIAGQKPGSPSGYPARVVYVLLVRGPDGGEQQVAMWSPPPGQDVDVQAATNLTPGAVAGLEVRTGSGELVLAS